MNKDQILARELGKLGAIGGGAGGVLGGILAGVTGTFGGASGAWIAARFLPTESYVRPRLSAALRCKESADDNCLCTCGLGRLQDSSEINSPNPTIAAVIGSGFTKMNSCVLTIEVVSHSDKEATAVIRGAAKGGTNQAVYSREGRYASD